MGEESELLAELRALHARLDDIHRRHVGPDPAAPPPPEGRHEAGVPGPVWTADDGRWTIVCPENAEDRNGCILVHTPHSLHGPSSRDFVAVPYGGAVELAEMLLGAVGRARYEDMSATSTWASNTWPE